MLAVLQQPLGTLPVTSLKHSHMGGSVAAGNAISIFLV